MPRMTRRKFVSLSAGGAAALTAGTAALTAQSPARAASANEKVVLALIGAGGRGQDLAMKFAAVKDVEFKYVCEVNEARGGKMADELAKVHGRRPKPIIEMRDAFADKDVHGVVIATPEHWHALATIWACQAGKDVYVEKNVSLTIWEGRKMVEAARKYNRIVQAGTQNRSGPYAYSAREYLKSGRLGKIAYITVNNMLPGGPWQPRPDTPVPAGVDWDRWLGPAPEAPYNAGRHFGPYDWWDYSGGVLAGDGSHQLDLLRLVLGDPPPPKAAYCAGGNQAFGSKRETPELQVVTFDYGDFTVVSENTSFPPYMVKSTGQERMGDKFPFWPQNCERIEIYGTKQMMYLGRHGMGWQVLEGGGKIVAQEHGYFPDKWHQPNFIDCIRSRQRPNGDIEQAHLSACLVHMGNIAYRLGNQRVVFDAKAEAFVGSDAANRFLKPAYRKEYRVPDEV